VAIGILHRYVRCVCPNDVHNAVADPELDEHSGNGTRFQMTGGVKVRIWSPELGRAFAKRRSVDWNTHHRVLTLFVREGHGELTKRVSNMPWISLAL
jgi:hypothetical protein